MVKRKPTKNFKAKSIKPKVIDQNEEDADIRIETLNKRLEDFDMQGKHFDFRK